MGGGIMGRYDAVIIGAGLSGLCVGALLSHRGQRVLLLEREPVVGGRAKSLLYRGHVLDNGAHMPSEPGHLEEVFRTLGLEYPRLLPYPNGEGYYEGAWRSMKEIFPLGQAKGVLRKFAELSDEEVERYSDISIADWCAPHREIEGWLPLFQYLGQLGIVGNKVEDLSMGELIFFFREHFLLGKGLSQIGGTVFGGLKGLTEPLRSYIEDHGGEIRLSCPVNDIVVENGVVRGVELEVGERLFSSQILDTEVVEAPVVICTLPIWDLFQVISEEEFPPWYRDWIWRLRGKVCHVWTVVCAVDRPLWDLETFKWCPRLPRAGVFGLFFQHRSYGDAVKEVQVNLVLQGHYGDLPDLSEWRWAKTRRAVRRFLDLLEEDARELIPGLAEATKWRVRHAAVLGLAESPGLSWRHRPSMVPPGIQGLYLLSDTVREARGLGMQSVAKASLVLVERLSLRK
jgi:hypothetical protein